MKNPKIQLHIIIMKLYQAGRIKTPCCSYVQKGGMCKTENSTVIEMQGTINLANQHTMEEVDAMKDLEIAVLSIGCGILRFPVCVNVPYYVFLCLESGIKNRIPSFW